MTLQDIRTKIANLIQAETGATSIEVTISENAARGKFISICGPIAEVAKTRAFMSQTRELIASETEDPADECFDVDFAPFAFDFYRA